MSTALFTFKYRVKKILNPTDENTLNLLSDYTMTNGRNYDVLIKIENDTITAKTLEQLIEDTNVKLHDKICYTVDNFPWIDPAQLEETIFIDWTAPSFYDRFRAENNKIIVEQLEQHTIPLKDYIDLAKNKVEQNMKHILDNSNNLIMLYSRGIDSLLVLSYLIKYDRLKDTRLIHCGHGPSNKSFIDYNLEKKLGIDVETLFFRHDDIVKYANQPNPFKFRECISRWVLEQFNNDTIITGYEGNSVLMHKWEWVKRLGTPITEQNIYVQDCLNIDWWKPTDLNHHTITFIEPYSRNWNNPKEFGRMLSPISDLELMKILPFVDIRGMDPNFIGDAIMIRDMIYSNVGNKLNSLINKETITWNRPIFEQDIDVDKLNNDAINIKILRDSTRVGIKRISNIKGVANLIREIDKAKKSKKINVRLLMIIKYINYLL